MVEGQWPTRGATTVVYTQIYGRRLGQSLSKKSLQHSRCDPKFITSCHRALFDTSSRSFPAGYFIRDLKDYNQFARQTMSTGPCTDVAHQAFMSGAFHHNCENMLWVVYSRSATNVSETRHRSTETEITDTRPWWSELISNLSFLSKTIERVVAACFDEHVETHNLLPSRQSAYRAQHSTETAVIDVQNRIVRNIDRRGQVSVLVLLHLSSAFDTVYHAILLECWQSVLVSQESSSTGFAHTWTDGRRHSMSEHSNQQHLLFTVVYPNVESLGH